MNGLLSLNYLSPVDAYSYQRGYCIRVYLSQRVVLID